MKERAFSAKMKQKIARIPILALALAAIGASPTAWPDLSKGDRPPSIADCRSPEMKAEPGCSGIVLPETVAEAYEVAPGLSIVDQVNF